MTLKLLEVHTGQEWRTWLREHHSSSPGVWLVFRKRHTMAQSILYEDSVRQALCFGWIDSLIKRLDDDRYARKFTPRQPASKWSESNRKRWLELQAAGLLAPAGVAAAPTANRYGPLPAIPDLPDYIAQSLQANPQAWNFFQELAPTHRRHFVTWIHMARRTETKERRLCEAIRLLAAGEKLGLK